jgi:hypothetical protein
MNDDKINEVITNLRHCDAHYDHIEHDTFENAIEAIEQLIKERDEARREVCDLMNMDWIGCVEKGNKETAISRGWDCYKKETP